MQQLHVDISRLLPPEAAVNFSSELIPTHLLSSFHQIAAISLKGVANHNPVSSSEMDAARVEKRRKAIQAIQLAVADLFGMQTEHLCQKGHERVVTVPRQIAMYLAKQLTDASLPEIGACFGGRHHTTVMYAIAKIHEQRLTDTALDRVVAKLSVGLANIGDNFV